MKEKEVVITMMMTKMRTRSTKRMMATWTLMMMRTMRRRMKRMSRIIMSGTWMKARNLQGRTRTMGGAMVETTK